MEAKLFRTYLTKCSYRRKLRINSHFFPMMSLNYCLKPFNWLLDKCRVVTGWMWPFLRISDQTWRNPLNPVSKFSSKCFMMSLWLTLVPLSPNISLFCAVSLPATLYLSPFYILYILLSCKKNELFKIKMIDSVFLRVLLSCESARSCSLTESAVTHIQHRAKLCTLQFVYFYFEIWQKKVG